MKTEPTEVTTEELTEAPAKPRDSKGKFTTAAALDGPGATDFDQPDNGHDMSDDPFLSSLDPEVAEGVGLTAGEPAAPAGEPAAGEPAAEEPAAEAPEVEDAGGDDDEGDDEIDPVLATQAGMAMPGEEPAAPEKPAGGTPDLAFLTSLAQKDPALAAKVLEAMGGKSKPEAPAAAAQPTDEAAFREEMRALWNSSVASGKDFDAIFAISEKIASRQTAPVREAEKQRSEHQKFLRAKAEEFAAFEKANPGWKAHRDGMLRALQALERDPEFGPAKAARVHPQTLLRMAAPDFKPAKAGKSAPPPVKIPGKPAPKQSVPAPTTAAKKGSEKGSLTKEQETINKTVARLEYDRRVANAF